MPKREGYELQRLLKEYLRTWQTQSIVNFVQKAMKFGKHRHTVTVGGHEARRFGRIGGRIGEARTLLAEVTASGPAGAPLPRFHRAG